MTAGPPGDSAAGVVSTYAGGLGGRNEGEAAGTGALDEMLDPHGAVRTAWTDLATQLDWAGPAGLIARSADTRRLLADDGVSYRPPGGTTDQPWALDPLPVLFDSGRWTELAAGLAQRAQLLDRLLADLRAPTHPAQRAAAAGVGPRARRLPARLVRGPDTPSRRELFLAGADVARTEHGWQLISDRVQAPSGAGYAMANRRVVARVLPAVHPAHGHRPPAPVLRRGPQWPVRVGPRRRRTGRAAGRAADARAAERDRLRAGPALLAARLPAGARLRPHRPRGPGLATGAGPAGTGGRDPAPGRRGLVRSARPAPGLPARGARAARGGPTGHGRGGQRHRQRGDRESRPAALPAGVGRGAARRAAGAAGRRHLVVRRAERPVARAGPAPESC